MTTTTTRGVKMVARFPGKCASCAGPIAAGAEMVFYRSLPRPAARTWHVDCARAESLRYRIQALWFKAYECGGRDEVHYRPQAEAAEKEREALLAQIAARVEAA